MTTLLRTSGRAVSILLTAAALAAANTTVPPPGTVNYVEGQASLNGEMIEESSAGPNAVAPNQVLDTARGKVELLLTPGAFLRLGDGSELRIVSTEAPNIQFELVKGGAILEAGQFFKGISFAVLMDGATINITKEGLYLFAADQHSVGVLDGEAVVYQGNAHITLKKGHGAFLIAGQLLKSQNLDVDAISNEPLMVWSSARSAYQAQAGIQASQAIIAGGGPYDSGWFWDTSLDCFAFVPFGGIGYNLFGWGFYAPVAGGNSPHPIHYPIPGPRKPRKPNPPSAALNRAANTRASSAKAASTGHTNSGGGVHFGGGGGGGHMGGGGGGGHR